MTLSVPDYILSLKPYAPGKPIEELEREYGINDSIKLASNENPLGPSPMAVKAIGNVLGMLNRYPDGGGHDLTGKLSEDLNVAPENIVLGNGSDDIIGMLARVFLKPGDEAIMPKPSFLMYDIMVNSSGATPVHVPLKSLALDLQGMAAKITKKTRLIFICNPNNPTGTIVSKKDFNRFLENIPENVPVVLDEAYIEFVRDPECVNGVDYINSGRAVVTLRTFSKAYGLAGLRIGYGVMPKEIAELLHRVRQPFNANRLAQAGALAALEDEPFLTKTVGIVHKGIDYLFESLEKMRIQAFPTQANFLLIDVGRDADAVFEKMLRMGVIVRSMKSYGYPEYIRINAGLPEENARFISALKAVMQSSADTEKIKKQNLLITIDGPAGAGKTTIAKMLSDSLGYKYIDTGALYRGVAFEALSAGISHDDHTGLKQLCDKIDLNFVLVENGLRLFSGDTDLTDRIRTPEITMFASAASALPVVREALLKIQRDLGREKRAVFEGRDMGTVVFPDADLKFFLDADSSTRAVRRHKELSTSTALTVKEVKRDIDERDKNDSSRVLAPLKPADDAIIIDSTSISKEEVLAIMMSHIELHSAYRLSHK
ncbi:histidinol-phosphate aminotransferase [Desulfosarcina sp. BuS5]|uniref:histidinol-phosphate transaminase n=1 Tax=Desulfosarcina sp. BuS5 TaxID=933262 RepID=UPI000A0416B7|nr:histidinol-phosphate aminotransferase [Desulfosarcina sp. BuS5]